MKTGTLSVMLALASATAPALAADVQASAPAPAAEGRAKAGRAALDPGAAAELPAASPSDGIVDLEAMVVSGAQPGPGLWKIRHGDHVLHILGTVSPLPRRMEWASAEVESVISRSQVMVSAPAFAVDADVGFFRGLGLMPAMLRARNNPGNRQLREVVSPELYARWEVLKARYMGRARGVEKRRPLVAAQELYKAALDRSGLRAGGVIGPVVKRARKAGDVPLLDSTVRIHVDDPKGILKEFSRSDLADRECFAGTMARIETDLDAMRARANAWAVGDIEALRRLPHENHYALCQDALTGSAVGSELGLGDARQRALDAWLDNAAKALAEHPTSFGMLPMHMLLAEDGMLARLAERGYVIEAP